MEWEERARLAVFDFLASLAEVHGDVLPRSVLNAGVPFDGQVIRLLGPQGIFKPSQFTLPLSITTVPPVPGREPPYPDHAEGDLLRYSYRGDDPQHRDNVGLRWAMQSKVPLVYLLGVVPGQYLVTWPVFIVEDDPQRLQFTVALEAAAAGGEVLVAAESPARRYAVRSVRHRLHQRAFRERVLQAYQRACSMCQLRHAELLDAAHILPDTDERSTTAVSNGLALCKLHHAAFDHHIVGVRPDLVIEVRQDILAEVDGPMLRHGLQELEGQRVNVPRQRVLQPDVEFLNERYGLFRAVG
jgi:putative restriction endonuclease